MAKPRRRGQEEQKGEGEQEQEQRMRAADNANNSDMAQMKQMMQQMENAMHQRAIEGQARAQAEVKAAATTNEAPAAPTIQVKRVYASGEKSLAPEQRAKHRAWREKRAAKKAATASRNALPAGNSERAGGGGGATS